MRPAHLASLLAILLMVSGIQAGWRRGSEENGPPFPRRSPPEPVQLLRTWRGVGGGEKREEAEADALKNVVVQLKQYFAEQDMPLSWTPDVEYLRDHLMKEKSKEIETRQLGPGLGSWLRVEVLVVLNSDDRDDMLRRDREFRMRDREFRMRDREFFLGKVLLVLVALLTAVAGYFRLDEATKGYYTGWLRLAAASLVGAAATGLWWMS